LHAAEVHQKEEQLPVADAKSNWETSVTMSEEEKQKNEYLQVQDSQAPISRSLLDVDVASPLTPRRTSITN